MKRLLLSPSFSSALAVLLSGCVPAGQKIYTPDEVLQKLGQRLTPELMQDVVIPYEIDDEIRELAVKVTENVHSDRERTRALVQAIISRTGLSISYDWLSNKTAKEVFREGRGNCLAYTNLFIGMARHVGLEAVYVDVVTIERISKEAEVIVNNGHITAGVQIGPQLVMIDFTRTPEREYAGYKVIDDLEAIANYYNNQGFLYGYYSETAGDDGGFDPLARELEMYRMALEVHPNFHRARNNLGVALKRRGDIAGAVEQYKKAIETNPDFAEAHSNLGSAYYSTGRIDEALEEFRIAAKAAGSNAYFYHHLGVIHFQQRDYPEAIRQFKKALSHKSDLADATFYLGECYLKLGNTEQAIKEYERTLAIDPNYLSARAKLSLLVPDTPGLNQQ